MERVTYFNNMRKVNIVVSTGHRKWAIGELAQNLTELMSDLSPRIIEVPQSRRQIKSPMGWIHFPSAPSTIFMQQDLLLHAMQRDWHRKTNFIILRYTHNNRPLENYRSAFEISNRILVENSFTKFQMVQMGIDQSKIEFKPHPIEWAKFNYVRSTTKLRDVIFVSNFYKRKRPDLILETVKSMPNLKFTIYGRNWDTWKDFSHLQTLSNLDYINFNYSQYPDVLSRHRVFCSLSEIEGGPVPLLESLTAGLVPVVTDTGYARDVNGLSNGIYVIPQSPTINQIKDAILLALSTPAPNLDTKQFDLASYISFIRQTIYPHIS